MNHYEQQNTINGIKDLQNAKELEHIPNLQTEEPRQEDQAMAEHESAIRQLERTILFNFSYIGSLKHKKLLADQGKTAEIQDIQPSNDIVKTDILCSQEPTAELEAHQGRGLIARLDE